jgi:hypothetical protein
MLKLVAAFAVLGALAAGVFLIPIRGRTIADRWGAASSPAAFATNAWDEGRSALTGDRRGTTRAPSPLPQPAGRRSSGAQEVSGSRRGSSRGAAAPVEHHTSEDRAALDRLLSERTR